MFNVNEQAVKAEDNYRRELMRDQNQKSGNLRRVSTVIVIASALAFVLAACGVPSNDTGTLEAPGSIDGIHTDPGPSWQPNTGAVSGGGVVLVPEVGGMVPPIGPPSAGILEDYLPDHGVFAGPTWQPNLAELEKYLGIDTSFFAGPSHQPDLGKLDEILNPQRADQPGGPN